MKVYKIILALMLIFVMYGCVSKSQYDEKVKEVEYLKAQVEELQKQINEKINLQKTCNEDFALTELKRYLAFYSPKCKFLDFNVRKVDDCSFDIIMKKLFNDGTKVGVTVRMTFFNDGKYEVKNLQNDPVWACND